jgi:hypothetical protein
LWLSTQKHTFSLADTHVGATDGSIRGRWQIMIVRGLVFCFLTFLLFAQQTLFTDRNLPRRLGQEKAGAMSFRLPLGLVAIARNLPNRAARPPTIPRKPAVIALSPFFPTRFVHQSLRTSEPSTSAAAGPSSKLPPAFFSLRTPSLPHLSFPSVGLKRSLSTSNPRAIRQTYFPQGSRYGQGGSGGGGRGGWWTRFRRRIDQLPEMTVVRLVLRPEFRSSFGASNGKGA